MADLGSVRGPIGIHVSWPRIPDPQEHASCDIKLVRGYVMKEFADRTPIRHETVLEVIQRERSQSLDGDEPDALPVIKELINGRVRIGLHTPRIGAGVTGRAFAPANRSGTMTG